MPFPNNINFSSDQWATAGNTPFPPTGSLSSEHLRRHTRKPVVDLSKPLVPKKGFTFGCDPEGFLFDKKTKKPVPAAGLIPGTKWKPHEVDDGAVQVDGLAVEFNIKPASTYEEWEGNITSVLAQLKRMVPKGLEIKWVPSVKFPEDSFDAAPDEAKELGCDPDFDAYTGGTNPPPSLEDPYVRCAGGHLHLGFTKNESLSDPQHLMNCQDLGKQCDWFLGGWSAYKDPDTIRRKLYGKAGAIRYKDYGVEYRVLSNFWVPDSELRREVWDRMVCAEHNISHIFMPERVNRTMQDWLTDAINNHHIHPDLTSLANFPLLTIDERRRNF